MRMHIRLQNTYYYTTTQNKSWRGSAIVECSFQLPLPMERVLHFGLFVCNLQNQRFFNYISSTILLFCLSVCLSLCPSVTGHNFKPIFTKLHHMVEFVICKKHIVFEVKRSTQAKGQQLCQISKILNFHPIDLKFEQDLQIRSLNSTTNYFEVNIAQKATIGHISKIDPLYIFLKPFVTFKAFDPQRP